MPALPVLVAALPALFLHVNYQPQVDLPVGGSDVTVTLADVAVLAVVAAALLAGRRDGFGVLRTGRWVWLTATAFVAWIVAATFYPVASDRSYDAVEHLVTAAKYAEYVLLAPAVALIVRSDRHLRVLLAGLAAVSVAATFVALLQFAGLATAFGQEPQFVRVPSIVGFEDFALLSTAALLPALLQLHRGAVGRDRALAWVALLSGATGLVLSGALGGALGLVLGAAALLVLLRVRRESSRRGTVLVVATVAVVLAGTVLIRDGDIAQFMRFVGVEERRLDDSAEVSSYNQRTVLAYIGLKMWLANPVLGVGWQGSLEESGYGPHLDDARARFPDEPSRTFPSPDHPWGVHNAYIQALSDLGLPGLVLLVAALAVPLVAAVHAARRAPPAMTLLAFAAVLWLAVAIGMANATGLVAGIPLVAMTWIAAGLAVAAAEGVRGRS